MKRTLLILLLCILNFSFAQIRFEKGYMINNKKERSNILIKNQDWAYNPTEFTYKTSEEGALQIATINDVQEFGVYNFSKYVRYIGLIDDSTDNLQRLTDTKDPIWVRKTVFLKELSAGERNLYMYNDDKILKFFYADANTPIEPLVYKRYFPEGNTANVFSNNDYKTQLNKYFDGENVERKIDRLSYKQESLTNFFKNYKGFDNSIENEELNRSKVNLYVKAGIAFSSAELLIPANPVLNTQFESKISPRVGVEVEYVFPFKKNKLAVFVEPTFQTYNQTGKNNGGAEAEIKYSTVEVALGLRYYMFLNATSKFFVDGSINALNLMVGDNYIQYKVAGLSVENSIKLNGRPNFGFSVGYTYNNKWVIQAKTYNRKKIVTGTNYIDAGYSNVTIAVGYNFL